MEQLQKERLITALESIAKNLDHLEFFLTQYLEKK